MSDFTAERAQLRGDIETGEATERELDAYQMGHTDGWHDSHQSGLLAALEAVQQAKTSYDSGEQWMYCVKAIERLIEAGEDE